MPKAIFLTTWDPRRGPIIVGQYPPEYDLDRDRLLDFLGLALRQGEAAHFSEIELRGEKAIVYFTGIQTKMCFGAIADEDDDLDMLRGSIVRVVIDLILRGITPSSIEEWKMFFEKVSLYQEMPMEEKIGELFNDDFVTRVYGTLLEFGIIRRDFLLGSLGILHGTREEELLDAYMEVLSSLGVVQTYFDEESMREYIFLLRDVAILRRKPRMFEEIARRVDGYEREYEEYVRTYIGDKKWSEEQELLAQIFANPSLYMALRKLREKGVISFDEAQSEDIAPQLELLETVDICRKKENMYYMFTDAVIVKIFPKYSIHKCLQQYAAGVLTQKEVEAYLEAIKKSYM